LPIKRATNRQPILILGECVPHFRRGRQKCFFDFALAVALPLLRSCAYAAIQSNARAIYPFISRRCTTASRNPFSTRNSLR
jgi:hypothetical protein